MMIVNTGRHECRKFCAFLVASASAIVDPVYTVIAGGKTRWGHTVGGRGVPSLMIVVKVRM